jgi:TPR repeat protein
MSAFRRSLARGAVGLGIVMMTVCAHLAARGDLGLRMFDESRCDNFGYKSCGRLADAVRESNPERAMLLYDKACGATSVESCVAAGELYLSQSDTLNEGYWPSGRADAQISRARADNYFERACRYGDRRGCLLLAR